MALSFILFLTASQLGTAVVSVQVLLHTPHARTHPTHYEYSNKPTTILRLDRVLEEITGTIHGAVDDGHVVLPLWLHARERLQMIFREATVPGGNHGRAALEP
jgi:hypothetical protein